MLQSDDARRVLVQDNATRTTAALRGDRWSPICPSLGAERCVANSPRADLGVFLVQRSYDDPSGVFAALVSYDGERLAPSDGRIAVHASEWSVLTDLPRTILRSDDGTLVDLDMLEGELPSRAVGGALVTWSNDYRHVWLRDPPSGSRTELLCADGRVPIEIANLLAELVCCDRTVFRLLPTGLVEAGTASSSHRCDGEQTRLVYVEDGQYTVTVRERERTSALSFVAPDGHVIAAIERDYPAEPVDSYARLRVYHPYRASPGRFVAYVELVHLGVAHDDFEITREEGVIVFDAVEGAIAWHPIQPADAPSYGVWFPRTAERGLWVTPDGRLVSFELDTRALVDRTNGLQFRANIQGG
jgi:hypothetical protein